MQLVHEAAVCTRGIRAERTLHQRGGFELANGLPFVATDEAIHHLLGELTVAMELQVALGKIRLASGDFQGKLLAIDPHLSGELINDIHHRTGLDLLVPLPSRKPYLKGFEAIHEEQFTRRWAGYATAKVPIQIKRTHPGKYYQFVQRHGERCDGWRYKGFWSTADRAEVETLTVDYPKRWPVEEFFNANQALGWNRAGTMNLNIRYAPMTMALMAQAAIHQLRGRLGDPYRHWDANHLAKDLFHRLEADVRVNHDTIIVTYYNAPDELRAHYEDLPDKLTRENVRPTVPWLYHYQLDFRFR